MKGLPARLAELAQLPAGWLDGEGLRPDPEGLAWLAGAWQAHWPAGAMTPRAYPMLDGNVQLEWDACDAGIVAEVDLESHLAWVLLVRTDESDLFDGLTIDLDEPASWQRLLRMVLGMDRLEDSSPVCGREVAGAEMLEPVIEDEGFQAP